jgi:acetolactate synthase I/II/III large subunit
MEKYVNAEALVEVLNSHGVEHIFFNPGIDTVPIQVAVYRFKEQGKKSPGLILCLDESVAMTAAHGHYMVSGRPQVVLVHSELGTYQIGGTITNAQRGRIPALICAAARSEAGRKNWRTEPYDQGAILRNCVKWDYEVKADDNFAAAADKALQIALSEPCGPVYLTAPLSKVSSTTDPVDPLPAMAPAETRPIDLGTVEKAADVLLGAASPLILAGNSGRDPASVPALVSLAETLGCRVISGPVRMNFPTTHPLFSGFDPISGGCRGIGHLLTEADVILMIDYDLPYAVGPIAPNPEAKILYIDLDRAKKSAPLWNHPPAVFVEAASAAALPALQSSIARKLNPAQRQQFARRFQEIEIDNRRMRREWQDLARNKSSAKPISPDWLSLCLAEVIDEDAIIVNQTITHSSSVAEQMERARPGTFLSCAGGSIGWPLGAALGAKLAAPDKTVVSLMGDGAFIWGCPTATLWAARAYHAPFLSVIFDNQAYGAIKGLVQRAFKEEKLSPEQGFNAGVDISMPPDYSAIARACGAFGSIVDDPSELLVVLREALLQVRRGKAAVVDVRLG